MIGDNVFLVEIIEPLEFIRKSFIVYIVSIPDLNDQLY